MSGVSVYSSEQIDAIIIREFPAGTNVRFLNAGDSVALLKVLFDRMRAS